MYRIMPVIIGLVLIFNVNIVSCSWQSLTTEEMIERADLILIGEILGPVNEELINIGTEAARIEGIGVTNWKVEIHHILKGKMGSNDIIVTTPGAENVGVQTSIDYRLDDNGKLVMLFLQEEDMNVFLPLNPQAVIPMKLKNNNKARDIFERYTMQVKLKKELEEFNQKNSEQLQFLMSNNETEKISSEKLLLLFVFLLVFVWMIWRLVVRKKKIERK